jgi:hypothetical protein
LVLLAPQAEKTPEEIEADREARRERMRQQWQVRAIEQRADELMTPERLRTPLK